MEKARKRIKCELFNDNINKFPTTRSEQEPGRPAVIVSNDTNNETAETVEVVYLTTKGGEFVESPDD